MPAIRFSAARACLSAIPSTEYSMGVKSRRLSRHASSYLLFFLFPKCCALQNFLRSAIPITLGVRITNHNVKNSGPPSLPNPKAVRSNISTGFVAQHLTPHLQSSVPHSISSHRRFLVRRRFERASRPSSTSVPILRIRRHAAVPQSHPSYS